jgi:hypothetical protein
MLGEKNPEEKDSDTIIICENSKEEWSDRRLEKYIQKKFDSQKEVLITKDFEPFGITKERLHVFFAANLGTTLSAERNLRIVNFFVENMSAEAFEDTLRDKDYSYLKIFAIGASTLQEASKYTEPEKKLRIEKFKLLLQKNTDLVTEFIGNHKRDRYMEKALVEYEQASVELGIGLANGSNNHQ